MDQKIERPAPYFDSQQFRAELTQLAHGEGKNETKLRSSVLGLLKDLIADAREQAERTLLRDNSGRRCAEGLSLFQDELIRVIYDFAVHHVYRAKNPSAAERMAVVATGGYGRGMLAPGSDIDLLFLLPYKQTAWGESVVEYILYLLWDLGFKVGHATRSAGQCVKLSNEDMTIRTALLDARLIWGDEPLFTDMQSRFVKEVVDGSGREFIEAKLAERDERHQRAGESRYKVEPNIKDGKGGLRDLHTLHWLAAYLTDFGDEKNLVEAGVFSSSEYHGFLKAEEFLWTVRCHLHFLTGRPEERLTFDVQPAMAERLGYNAHGGLRTVERFMRHYFLTAKDVGDLTRIVCSVLELKQLKSTPKFSKILFALPWKRSPLQQSLGAFKIENGRINVAHKNVFKDDPVNLLRLFLLADDHEADFHPEALRLVRTSVRLISPDVRENPEANEIFLKLLTARKNPERALRHMNEAGVLGRFVPDFGRIVSMMQFNMYHHYTVDEHLLLSIGILHRIEQGELADDHPLTTKIIHTIKNRRALYVAMFLHDIAKGRPEDHSIAGAEVARNICPRFGLSKAETETVSWLVEHHLVMSQFAQSRDVNDPKTIKDFADIVQSLERLNLLITLTVADISAVGPGVWNGWKGQLLRALYYEVEPLISGGHSTLSHSDRVVKAQEDLRRELSDWEGDALDRFIDRHYPAYWLRTDLERQIAHAKLIDGAETRGDDVVTHAEPDAFRSVTALTIFAPSHPRLLQIITGACAAAGANIVDAQITTTRDGRALDTIFVQREFDLEEDEFRRADRIFDMMKKQMSGDVAARTVMAQLKPPSGRVQVFTHAPEVVVDNSLSDELTVLEVTGRDRPGLLFELTRVLSNLNLDIASAHIATFGEKAVDVFYVTDLCGKKITSDMKQAAVTESLIDVLLEEDDGSSDG